MYPKRCTLPKSMADAEAAAWIKTQLDVAHYLNHLNPEHYQDIEGESSLRPRFYFDSWHSIELKLAKRTRH